MDDINTLRRILRKSKVDRRGGLSATGTAELLRRQVHAGAWLPVIP
jgi:hypothetical protein